MTGGGPAFSAYPNANLSLSTGAYTKLLFQVEEFDTNSNFDSSRFTPTVAGYYQVVASTQFVGGTTGEGGTAIYKNGTMYKLGNDFASASSAYVFAVTCLVYCNGTTDYIEAYAYSGIAGRSAVGNSTGTYFQASMVRAA